MKIEDKKQAELDARREKIGGILSERRILLHHCQFELDDLMQNRAGIHAAVLLGEISPSEKTKMEGRMFEIDREMVEIKLQIQGLMEISFDKAEKEIQGFKDARARYEMLKALVKRGVDMLPAFELARNQVGSKIKAFEWFDPRTSDIGTLRQLEANMEDLEAIANDLGESGDFKVFQNWVAEKKADAVLQEGM